MCVGAVATKDGRAPDCPVDDLKKFFKLGRTEPLRPNVGTRFRNENKENGREKAERVAKSRESREECWRNG